MVLKLILMVPSLYSHAQEVVERYQKISIDDLLPLLPFENNDINLNVLPTDDDLAYRAALEDSVLDPEILNNL